MYYLVSFKIAGVNRPQENGKNFWNLPSEVEKRFDGGGDPEVRPSQEVELRHGAGLVRLQVLQVETSHQVIVAPYMFRHQMDLKCIVIFLRN